MGLLLVVGLLAGACSADNAPEPVTSAARGDGPAASTGSRDLPALPDVGDGPLAAEVVEVLEHRFWLDGRPREADLPRLGASGDVRLVWPLLDLLRWEEDTEDGDATVAALEALTGWSDDAVGGFGPRWVNWTDALLAADVPAPPDYLRYKRAQHKVNDPWADRLYDDAGKLDWREVTWGGVPIGGIAALDHPEAEPVTSSRWLRDDDLVVGIEVDGEARAYPTRVLDVHEMVNDSLGGTNFALAYCTLCLTATAWVMDGIPGVDGTAELGTSGLLRRSNKLMIEWSTWSLIDQFDGVAVAGPLAHDGVSLEALPVVTATFAEWRAAHPDATVVSRPLPPNRNLGDPYDGTFLDDRSGTDPLFPVGETDPRLPPMEVVVGVDAPRGVAVAFPVELLDRALQEAETVAAGGVEVRRIDGALSARPAGGGPALPLRRAHWFAWSQFRPGTLLWLPEVV